METEYEATFLNINKDEVRKKLKEVGATLTKPEFLQKRVPFHLPKEKHSLGKFVRVRDEGDKITFSLKIFEGENKIEDQKEICVEINDFEGMVKILELIGCQRKSYQESKREIWVLDDVEIMIDEWPFLEPFVEVEGKSEEAVKKVSKKIGFDYSQALFCSTDKIYEKKYGMPVEKVNSIPKIVFDMENPFLS